MRILSTLLLLLLSTPDCALAAETPPEPCGGQPCTPRLREIEAGFNGAETITRSDLPLLASGECYHLNENYRPETTHYGVAFLDEKDGNTYMAGSFGFFFPENPYKGWTVDSARQTPNLYTENHRVELTDKFAFSDMNPGKTPIWWYWVKKSGDKVYLMGHWGVFHRLLCEMTVHTNR